MSAIDHRLAYTLVRQWSGLPGYPFHVEGESRLANTLVECSISVDHARALVANFEEKCPTPRDLKDAAFALREKFAPPKPDLIKQWKAEGATYDPDWSENLLKVAAGSSYGVERAAMRRQAIVDMLHYTEGAGKNESHDRLFWANARRHDLRDHAALVEEIREEIRTGKPAPPARAISAARSRPTPAAIPAPTVAEPPDAQEHWQRSKEKLRERLQDAAGDRELTEAAGVAETEDRWD